MAYANSKAKKEEPAQHEKRQPDYVVRTKVGDYWVSIGVAFSAQLKDGVVGYSLKLNTLPIGFTGDCLLMPPLPDRE